MTQSYGSTVTYFFVTMTARLPIKAKPSKDGGTEFGI
jgi:hypothetical protein